MTNWAQRQKEALAATTPSATPSGMKRIGGGGGEAVDTFYRFTVPTKEGSTQLKEGDVIEGTYLGSPVSKTFDKPFHKIRTTKGIVALPSAGQLDKAFTEVPVGTDVKVVYKGKISITTGKYAGKPAHSFDVFAAA